MRIRAMVAAAAGLSVGLAVLVAVPSAHAAAPGAPVNIVATQTGVLEETVSWTLSADDPQHPTTLVNVYISVDGGPFAFEHWVRVIDGSSFTEQLPPVHTYVYKLGAVNDTAESLSDPSNALFVTVFPGPVPSIATTAVGDGFVSLAWQAPSDDGGDPITAYAIYRAPNTQPVPTFRQIATVGTSAPLGFTDRSVLNWMGYAYRVQAINKWGDGVTSFYVLAFPFTTPPRPQSVSIRRLPGNVVHVLWDDDPGSIPHFAGYRVETSAPGVSCYVRVTHCDLHGLRLGYTYRASVVATNGIVSGPATASPTFVAADVPDAPRSAKAVAAHRGATVSWTAPKSDNFARITAYRITSLTTGKSTLVAPSVKHVTIAGLKAGAAYRFSILAINSIGRGRAVVTTTIRAR
jgi:hypothetical protein